MDEFKDKESQHFVNLNKIDSDEKVKIGIKDVIAIMIAQFQILFPLAIGAAVIITLVMLFIMKVWFRQ